MPEMPIPRPKGADGQELGARVIACECGAFDSFVPLMQLGVNILTNPPHVKMQAGERVLCTNCNRVGKVNDMIEAVKKEDENPTQ